MPKTTLGLLLLLISSACLASSDVWETLFKEKLREASTGNSNAQYDVGTMYQNGRGVTANRGRAIDWYRKAAAQNDQKAISRLKLIQSNEERFNRTLTLAEKGDLDSQYDLGNMYTEGIGVDQDMTKAAGWYEKAAIQGNEKAQYKLGLIYYEKSSTKKDQYRAFGLFRKAAEKGYPAAQFYLGKMYASGRGVVHDNEMALNWFRKAADGGFNEARREIINIAEILEDGPTDNKPVPARAKSATPKAKDVATRSQVNTPVYTYEKLMLASWNRDEQPVPYLPSAINNCRVEDDKIVCFSDDQSRSIAGGTIKYKTKAIVSSITQDGSFEVVYRNLVIDAGQNPSRKKAKADEVIGSTTVGAGNLNYKVKTGWGKENNLQCKFIDNNTLSCLKNKTHAFLLENPQALAAGK